jgi:acetate kinase
MPNPILVLNCGSSSIKYQVVDTATETVLAKGQAQRVGLEGDGLIEHETGGETFALDQHLADHKATLAAIFGLFDAHGPALTSVTGVAHRTVHGGQSFVEPTLITPEVTAKLQELSPLAPLHNPPALVGINATLELLPGVPQIAIFDTAFFAGLPAEAYTYAIDKDTAQKLQIRRYGFHGTSHLFVSQTAADFLGKPDLKQIICHLGNGASISAVDSGKPIDTSMGLTPLQGLVMGTRSGDVDPGLHKYLMETGGMSIDQVDNLLNKKSGMSGLCGMSDMRDIESAMDGGDADATLAWNVYLHRLTQYIGGYIALLGGADAIVFTAGIGENSDRLRADVCARLTYFGIQLDLEKNATRSKEPRIVSTPDSKVKVLVIPTNEELAMARQAAAAISGL